jgi:peptide-methionine (R)-S-oxide reductase
MTTSINGKNHSYLSEKCLLEELKMDKTLVIMRTPESVFIKIIIISLLIMALALSACGQNRNVNQSALNMNPINKPENPYYSHTDTAKLNLTDTEWKKILSPDVYEVSRHAATERPFTGKYWNADIKGTYYCAACGNLLFRSEAKFSSTCGWPSFFEQKNKNSTVYKIDTSLGMERTEVLCGRCGGHLGHIFDDGPQPTGKRYCMNSIAMDFIPDGK